MWGLITGVITYLLTQLGEFWGWLFQTCLNYTFGWFATIVGFVFSAFGLSVPTVDQLFASPFVFCVIKFMTMLDKYFPVHLTIQLMAAYAVLYCLGFAIRIMWAIWRQVPGYGGH